MSKINIKESLLNIDKSNYCKYDLTTLYECCSLDQKDKEKLVLMLYKECSAEELYDFLYQHFLNDTFDTGEDPIDEINSDDYFPYKVSDFIQDGEEIKVEYQTPFFETYNVSAGKIGAEDTIKFLNNILNNPKYKLSDKAKEKIYKNSAPWGLTVQMTPAVDVNGTNGLLSTGDFGGEASFGESIETNFEKDDRVTDGDRQGTVLDYDNQKVLVEWDYSQTDDIEWVDKSDLSFVECLKESQIPMDTVKKDIQSYLNYHLGSNEDYIEVNDVQNIDKDTVAVEYEVHLSIPIGNDEYERDTEYRSLPFRYKDGKWQPVVTESKYDIKTKTTARKLVDKAKADGKKLSMKDAEEIVDQSYNDKADNIDDFYKSLDLDESTKVIATGKEARKYLWNKIENSKDIKGYWKIEDDFINGGDITVVKDVSDVPNDYKYRFSFLDGVGKTPVEIDAYNNDLDWYIVDYLSDVKLEESVSGRYVWFNYNDIKDVKPKPQQVIDAYNDRYPDYDNPLTGIKNIEFAGHNYPEKELRYIVTDIDGKQFWAIVGNIPYSMLKESLRSNYNTEDGWTEEDINLHKSINWKSRNYMDFPVTTDSFVGEAILYGEGKDKLKNVKMIKYLVANPLYPPYYAPKENPFKEYDNVVGPMYDGRKHGSYQIHNRYETQELYDTLFESAVNDDCELVEALAPYKKEEFKKQLQDELYNKMIKLFYTPEWGYKNIKEIDDFINPVIDIEDYKGEYDYDIKVEFRAKLNYPELQEICNVLDKVIQKYDKQSYFEPVEGGIADAYLKFPKRLREDFEDAYTEASEHLMDLVGDEVSSEVIDYYIDDFGSEFVITYNNNLRDIEKEATNLSNILTRNGYKIKDWNTNGNNILILKFAKPISLNEEIEDDDELISAEQEFDSAATSINSNKLPAVYSMVKFNPGDVVVDFGGGKFDNAVNYLKDQDVTLLVYDPYNRSAEHNKEVLKVLREHGGADAAVNSNVLNVIKEPEARNAVLQNIKKITKKGAPIYITVYEGTGKGNEGPTKSGYQLNRKTADYIDEIGQVFSNVKRKGKLITAINESFRFSGLRQAIIDAIDYFMEFEYIYTFPKGKFLAADWEDLRDGIVMGIDDDLENAEGIMEYLQKEIDFNNKHKEIYEDDPQAELTLEIYNKVKKEYEKEISKYDSNEFEESLADKIRTGNLKYDEEIDAWYAEEDGIYVQFQDRQTNTYHSIVDPKDNRIKIVDRNPRVSSKTWARIWKDDKLVKSFEGPKYKVRADVIKYLDDNNKSEVLEETSYGGAFDIEDDQYFTKEEIVDVAEKVCEHLDEIYPDKFDVSDAYMETPTTIHIEVISKEGNWASANAKIDMRKIKKPSDIMKYDVVIGDLVYNLRQELEELYTHNSIFTESASEWRYVASKMVPDSDGFLTDYTWYENTKDGRHVFIFGDNDLYDDVDSNYADWEADSYSEARSWFDNYHGFDEEDM